MSSRLALVCLVLSGCVSFPPGRLEALRARPATTTFDPVGTWVANGGLLGAAVANQRITVTRDGINYRVERELLHNGVRVRLRGTGLMDKDRFFVAYPPIGFDHHVELYDIPSAPVAQAGPIDGIYANGHGGTGILHIEPRGAGPGLYAGRRIFDDYTLVGGHEHLKFKQRFQLTVPAGAPDVAYWAKWTNGGYQERGIGMAYEDRLVLVGMTTQESDFVYGVVAQRSGGVEVMCYRMVNGALEGTGFFGHTAEVAAMQAPPHPIAERWTR